MGRFFGKNSAHDAKNAHNAHDARHGNPEENLREPAAVSVTPEPFPSSDGEQPDEILAARAAAGDADAFSVLVRRYEKLVFRSVFTMLGSRTDAEDVTQEVFLRIWRGLPAFRGDAKFLSWLLSTAHNAGVDRLRKRKREAALFRELPEDVEQEPADTGADADPAEAVLRGERTEAVRLALRALPEEYRNVLQLRELEGMSCGKIASLLGIREGTVRTRLFRARKELKKILENGNFFEDETSNPHDGKGGITE